MDKATRDIEVQTVPWGLKVCDLMKDTTVGTSFGVIECAKYSPQLGEKVTLVGTDETGRQIAQFIQILNE